MNHNYVKVIACLIISFSGYGLSFSQNNGPEFLQCSDTLVSLCVQDEGVRLPANNQIYLGEGHPDATRGSAHVTRTKMVTGGCSSILQYKVALWSEDSTTRLELQPWTPVHSDTTGVATLLFDTAFSPDSVTSHSGISYNSNCAANYTIVWSVTDSCGTEVNCSEDLHLYDCSPPVPGSFGGPYIRTLPVGCFLTLFAKDFAAGSLDDRETFQHMLYSFDQHSYTSNLTVLCQYDFGVELPWTIWIADKGEDQNCNGFIEWGERNLVQHEFIIIITDNGGGCCEPIDPIISGKVTLPNSDDGIKDVEVTLTEPGLFYPTFVTGTGGAYTFNVLETGLEKTITCERNDHPKNGVSTLDLIKIQKHLLGRDSLDSPYLLIAADANNSQNVSAIDLIELRKLILGVYADLPNNESWRFVPADYVFQDPLDPWTDSIAPWPENGIGTITFTDVLNPGNLDFYGIKIGDVNNTVNPNLHGSFLPRSFPVEALIATNQRFLTGEIINVPIRIASDQKLTGFQFTLAATGMEILGLLPGTISVGEEDYALFNDQMTVSWFDEDNVNVSIGDILFTIQLKAHETGDLNHALSINSSITEAELYVDGEKTLVPELRIAQPDGLDELAILSYSPNPWKEETKISFYLPQSDCVIYTLTDINGRRIKSFSENLNAGYQSLTLKSSDFINRGMIFLEIRAGKEAVVQKMIVMD